MAELVGTRVYSGKLRDFQTPGAYGKVGGQWACHPPRGGVGMLTNHSVTEHEDGTITVSPSILLSSADPAQDWHGYLERGVWREV